MGRLFWKIFAGFWLTLLLTVIGVAAALLIREEAQRNDEVLAQGRRSTATLRMSSEVLHYGGEQAFRSMLTEWPERDGEPPLAVNAQGQDLFGRAVPTDALREARSKLQIEPRSRSVRHVVTASGEDYLLFLPATFALPTESHLLPPFKIETPIALALVALLASLGVSALLARHFSRPIRRLQNAFKQASNGQLGVRVAPTMAGRHDEIGELGREFDGMAQHLQQLVGSQSRLLHDVSHELRSPLARLQVAVGLARQSPAQVDSALNRIEREAEKLDALVGEVLTLSRLEAKKMDTADDYVDIVELLASIAEDARFETEGSGRHILFTSNVQGERVIRARGELLHRALENVVRNALRHTPPDSTVEINLDQNILTHRLHITVADSGPGVPENELSAIFDPFFRSEGASSGGYGLGLAIAQRAIEAHNGSMLARNRSSGGLEVHVELPITAT